MKPVSIIFLILLILLIKATARKSGPVSPATIFGFTAKNKIVLSATSKYAPQGMKLQSNYPWIRTIGDATIIALSGDETDCETLIEDVMKEFMTAEVTYDQRLSPMTTEEIAKYCRYRIVKALRKKPLQLSLLVGGFTPSMSGTGSVDDSCFSPCLYWIDELGTMKPCTYAAFGRELPFLLSLLDQYENEYRSGGRTPGNSVGLRGIADEVEINELVEDCWKIIQKRSNQELSSFQTKILTNPFNKR